MLLERISIGELYSGGHVLDILLFLLRKTYNTLYIVLEKTILYDNNGTGICRRASGPRRGGSRLHVELPLPSEAVLVTNENLRSILSQYTAESVRQLIAAYDY